MNHKKIMGFWHVLLILLSLPGFVSWLDYLYSVLEHNKPEIQWGHVREEIKLTIYLFTGFRYTTVSYNILLDHV